MSKLPTVVIEAEAVAFARDWLATARGCREFFDLGDPFNVDTMHAEVRRMCKNLADLHERNAARLVDLALAGAEDADQGLRDLIAERGKAGLPLGPSLTTYSMIISERPPAYRRPPIRPRENFFANFVIICLLICLMREFPTLRLRRGTATGARVKHRRPSACSIVATVLNDAGVGRRISEEGIRQIWKNYGPLVTPGFERIWPIKK